MTFASRFAASLSPRCCHRFRLRPDRRTGGHGGYQNHSRRAHGQEGRKAGPSSLECSKQADAKGLHGKERKKFRSECDKTAKAGMAVPAAADKK